MYPQPPRASPSDYGVSHGLFPSSAQAQAQALAWGGAPSPLWAASPAQVPARGDPAGDTVQAAGGGEPNGRNPPLLPQPTTAPLAAGAAPPAPRFAPPAPTPRRYLALVGNARVGKSHLLNLVAGENLFESEISPVGVTTTVEEKEVHGIVLLNIPGLLEANPKLIARNKAKLEEAMSKDGEYKVLFVFGLGNGGGIDGKDVAAYKEFCQGYGLERLPILLNNLDRERLGGGEAGLQVYLQRTLAVLQALGVDAPLGLVFHDDPTARALDQVLGLCSAFPWQRVAKKMEMNFDEKAKAVKEAMKQVEGLSLELERAREERGALQTRLHKAQELARPAPPPPSQAAAHPWASSQAPMLPTSTQPHSAGLPGMGYYSHTAQPPPVVVHVVEPNVFEQLAEMVRRAFTSLGGGH